MCVQCVRSAFSDISCQLKMPPTPPTKQTPNQRHLPHYSLCIRGSWSVFLICMPTAHPYWAQRPRQKRRCNMKMLRRETSGMREPSCLDMLTAGRHCGFIILYHLTRAHTNTRTKHTHTAGDTSFEGKEDTWDGPLMQQQQR